MATHTSAYTTGTLSTTGTRMRDVSDTIRHLVPGNPIQALVSSGLAQPGEVRREKGLIGKRRVESPKYEAFTDTPHTIEYTITARTDDENFTVSGSGAGIRPTYGLLNTRNMTTCRVTSNTSGALVAVNVGTTTFSCQTNDKLLVLGPAYGENSSSPYILMKDPDNMYNFTQIVRFAVAISRTAKGNPSYGGMRWRWFKEENVMEGLRKVENSMLFGERASGTDETTSDATLGDSFRTMRGLWNWAQTEFAAGGAMTKERFQTELPEAMDDTQGAHLSKVMLCGTKIFGLMHQWPNADLNVDQKSGVYDQYGVEARSFWTARGAIRVIRHDAFDRGDLNKAALVFVPDLVDYVHLRDDDIKAKPNIQNNDVDGQEDEILGEVSICPRDAGYSITKVTEWW